VEKHVRTYLKKKPLFVPGLAFHQADDANNNNNNNKNKDQQTLK